MKQPEQTHYYLIGNEIKKGTEVPESNLDKFSKLIHPNVSVGHLHWFNSLQPCSITDVELEKVKCYILLNTILTLKNTIDVTGIVEESIKKCDCCIIDCLPTRCLNPKVTLVFKQPKSEANEAVDCVKFANWILYNYKMSEEGMGLFWRNCNPDINTLHNSKELYEIFKNRNNK